MTTHSSIAEELKIRMRSHLFRITVLLNKTFYFCFHEGKVLHIYRVEGNLITYHAKEVSPDLDCDVVENHCLQIEEQHAADYTPTGGITSD